MTPAAPPLLSPQVQVPLFAVLQRVDLRPPASASELLERAKRLKAHERTPEAKEIAKGLREAEARKNGRRQWRRKQRKSPRTS